MKDNLFLFDNKISLFQNLAEDILDIAKKSIIEKNFFSIVLTGGSSTRGLYKILSGSESNFNKWHIYISDERILPKDHQDRNDRVIKKIWLDNNRIPKKNIHFIQAELCPNKAREEYEDKLHKVKKFDVVLLSVGEDGHIASLFPGHKYNNKQNVIIERNSPKPPKQRISISYQKLNNTKNLFMIIIGNSKRSIVRRLLKDERLPANSIGGDKKKIYIQKKIIDGLNNQ